MNNAIKTTALILLSIVLFLAWLYFKPEPIPAQVAPISIILPTNTPTTAPTVVPTTKPTTTPTPIEELAIEGTNSNYSGDTIFNEVNKYRAVNNKSQLVLKQDLCTFALARAKESISDWSHNGFRPMSKKYNYGFMVENLSSNYTSFQVVPAWINSPTHKQNLDANIKYGCVRCYERNCALIGAI